MIIIDYSQLAISTITTQLGDAAKKRSTENANLIKHMILVTILSYKKKFSKDYGNVLIACDSRHYWRKDVFPQYKANRAKNRTESDLDWDFIFEVLNEVKQTLKDVFPYKVVEYNGAEADDIFAVMCSYLQENELIGGTLFDGVPQQIKLITADGDMVQLQKYKNVSQYSPMQKKEVTPKGKLTHYVVEHIVRAGDDGIPNIKSPDNTFVDGIRQKSISAKYMQKFFDLVDQGLDPIDACENEEERKNFKRNKTLVSFDSIPKDVYDGIINAYHSHTPNQNKMLMMNYFIANKMAKLMSEINSF